MANKNHLKPPRLALRVFRWYCHADYVEDIEGDLLERFEQRTKENGIRSAKWQFTKEVLRLFRPGIIRPLSESQPLNQLDMLKNYFKVGIRNILKHKFYSALNISGLALGFAVCILIGLYVFDELNFDKFHKDSENIYQVGLHVNFGGQEFRGPTTSVPLAKTMIENVPGVEQAIRLFTRKDIVLRFEDKVFTETRSFYADSNFFEFFSFKLLEGNPKSVLMEPHTLVLTMATARKYFGNHPAIGQTIDVNNEAFVITGIVEEAPKNSQIQFDVLLSSESSEYMNRDWGNSGVYTYYRKNPNTSLGSIESKLKEIMLRHVAPGMEEALGMTFQEIEKRGETISFFSYPFVESHLYYPEIEAGTEPVGDIRFVYIIMAVGLFILLIACINFMNLSTARSANRAKEVGLRKTFGSARSKLIAQFLSESLIYVLAAMVLALGAAYLLLPSFNLLSGKSLSYDTMLSPYFIVGAAGLFVIIGILAGSYPSFYLTSFKPVAVLKGKVSAGMKSKRIRSSLVVIQFVISITFITCTIVVRDQLTYMQKRTIGLDKQNVLILQNALRLGVNQNAFVEELNKQSGIVSASYTNNIFPGVNNTGIYHTQGIAKDILIPDYYADYNHLDVLRTELVKGRYFSNEFPSDSLACVINETAVKELGWTDPLNEKLLNIDRTEIPVIGVIKDFNFESFKYKVKPLVIRLRKNSAYLLIRYNPDSFTSAEELVIKVEDRWKQLATDEPFEYSFLDQNYDRLYREDQRLSQFFTIMSGIAIFVACLGLLGLAAFTAEQRTKEIGIRKVMGASVGSINSLLSKDFMKLVTLSFVIACTLAWYAMREWLSTYAYRIELGPIVFLLAGFLAVTIAWLTVSYYFIKAARSNPVDALKYE